MEQKFNIEIDGVEKEAKVVNVINLEGKEILIYSVDDNGDTADLYFSEIVKDEEGFDKLIDVESEEIKIKVIELINSMLV